ncbi:MAG TPA: HPr family phosphocarrier protein [Xylella taiwanensis]
MLEHELIVPNKLGLHARATAKLVQTMSHFQSNTTLSTKGREVNAKSIMGVMLLAASQGTVIRVRIDGEDEHAAMQALIELFENRFNEDR